MVGSLNEIIIALIVALLLVEILTVALDLLLRPFLAVLGFLGIGPIIGYVKDKR